MDEITYWAGSQKLGAYQLAVNGSAINFALTETSAYFVGRLNRQGQVTLAVDYGSPVHCLSSKVMSDSAPNL
jgi:hypothetical protein